MKTTPFLLLLAFTLVMPITITVVLVEAILIFSYRQTIKADPSAGGAYIVTKDNLGLLPAQLAGVSLLVDYVLTVAVSTAAGVQAISTVYPLSVPVRVGLSLFFVRTSSSSEWRNAVRAVWKSVILPKRNWVAC